MLYNKRMLFTKLLDDPISEVPSIRKVFLEARTYPIAWYHESHSFFFCFGDLKKSQVTSI